MRLGFNPGRKVSYNIDMSSLTKGAENLRPVVPINTTCTAANLRFNTQHIVSRWTQHLCCCNGKNVGHATSLKHESYVTNPFSNAADYRNLAIYSTVSFSSNFYLNPCPLSILMNQFAKIMGENTRMFNLRE